MGQCGRPVVPALTRRPDDGGAMVKSGLQICGSADVDIDKLELNFIFRLRVNVRISVRVSISGYLRV